MLAPPKIPAAETANGPTPTMPKTISMTAKSELLELLELLELVAALDDAEATQVLHTLQAASFRAVLALAEEVEPDEIDRALLADVTEENIRPAVTADAAFEKRLRIA